jgi:hypothetical protein
MKISRKQQRTMPPLPPTHLPSLSALPAVVLGCTVEFLDLDDSRSMRQTCRFALGVVNATVRRVCSQHPVRGAQILRPRHRDVADRLLLRAVQRPFLMDANGSPSLDFVFDWHVEASPAAATTPVTKLVQTWNRKRKVSHCKRIVLCIRCPLPQSRRSRPTCETHRPTIAVAFLEHPQVVQTLQSDMRTSRAELMQSGAASLWYQ